MNPVRKRSLAIVADLLGRNPYEHDRKSASKMGSSTILAAAWTTRSRTVGTDISYCPSCSRELGCSGSVMELCWSVWCSEAMMPVGTDTVGLSGVFAWGGPAGGGVEMPGFGDAATAFGFDLLGPGDAQPVSGARAGGASFAGAPRG